MKVSSLHFLFEHKHSFHCFPWVVGLTFICGLSSCRLFGSHLYEHLTEASDEDAEVSQKLLNHLAALHLLHVLSRGIVVTRNRGSVYSFSFFFFFFFFFSFFFFFFFLFFFFFFFFVGKNGGDNEFVKSIRSTLKLLHGLSDEQKDKWVFGGLKQSKLRPFIAKYSSLVDLRVFQWLLLLLVCPEGIYP